MFFCETMQYHLRTNFVGFYTTYDISDRINLSCTNRKLFDCYNYYLATGYMSIIIYELSCILDKTRVKLMVPIKLQKKKQEGNKNKLTKLLGWILSELLFAHAYFC